MSIMYSMSGGHTCNQDAAVQCESCALRGAASFLLPHQLFYTQHTVVEYWLHKLIECPGFNSGGCRPLFHGNQSAGVMVTIYTLLFVWATYVHGESTDSLMYKLAKLCTVILVSWQLFIVYCMIVISVCVCVLNSFYTSTIIAESA